MVVNDVCYLVADDPATHGVFENLEETQRQVFCSVRSVGMQEAYRAMDHDLTPSFVVMLADPHEYNEEMQLIYKGKRYDIIRTYITDRGIVELTVEEARNA